MARALVPLGHTPPGPLDLTRLRSDLTALWREEGRGVSRACHATLVVVTASGEDVDPLLEDLLLTHPSRILRIEDDPKLPADDIVAWASACCIKRSSGMLVCSETIQFVVGEAAVHRLPSVIRSLAVGGVPLGIISRERSPLSLPWIQEIREDVDVIVGRSSALETTEALDLWHACMEGGHPAVQDLTWDDLDPWRRAIQGGFDRAASAARLGALSEVGLDIGDPEGALAAATLLAGWLGSRLDWSEPKATDPARIRVQHPGGETTIVFDRAPVSSALQGVTFSFADGGDPMRWSAEVLPVESPSAAIARVLHRHEPDPVALEACRFAIVLARARAAT